MDLLKTLTPEFLKYQVEAKGMVWFDDDSKPFNFNVIEVRSKENIPDVFNDWQCLIWNFQGKYEILRFRCTLDPGLFYLGKERMGNKYGTAVVMGEQQIRGYYKLGRHKGKYAALVQAKPAWFYRDFDRDNQLDLVTPRKVFEMIGANNHRGKKEGSTFVVGPYSAGCVVDENAELFESKIDLFKASASLWGDGWTRTILNESEFV